MLSIFGRCVSHYRFIFAFVTEEKASNKVLQIKEIQMQKLRNAHAIISAGTKDATENSDLY